MSLYQRDEGRDHRKGPRRDGFVVLVEGTGVAEVLELLGVLLEILLDHGAHLAEQVLREVGELGGEAAHHGLEGDHDALDAEGLDHADGAVEELLDEGGRELAEFGAAEELAEGEDGVDAGEGLPALRALVAPLQVHDYPAAQLEQEVHRQLQAEAAHALQHAHVQHWRLCRREDLADPLRHAQRYLPVRLELFPEQFLHFAEQKQAHLQEGLGLALHPLLQQRDRQAPEGVCALGLLPAVQPGQLEPHGDRDVPGVAEFGGGGAVLEVDVLAGFLGEEAHVVGFEHDEVGDDLLHELLGGVVVVCEEGGPVLRELLEQPQFVVVHLAEVLAGLHLLVDGEHVGEHAQEGGAVLFVEDDAGVLEQGLADPSNGEHDLDVLLEVLEDPFVGVHEVEEGRVGLETAPVAGRRLHGLVAGLQVADQPAREVVVVLAQPVAVHHRLAAHLRAQVQHLVVLEQLLLYPQHLLLAAR